MNVRRSVAAVVCGMFLAAVMAPALPAWSSDEENESEVAEEAAPEAAEAGPEELPDDIVWFHGKMKAVVVVDEEDVLVVTGKDGEEMKFLLNEATEILKGGKPMKLADVKKGDELCLLFFQESWGNDTYRIIVRDKEEATFECMKN